MPRLLIWYDRLAPAVMAAMGCFLAHLAWSFDDPMALGLTMFVAGACFGTAGLRLANLLDARAAAAAAERQEEKSRNSGIPESPADLHPEEEGDLC